MVNLTRLLNLGILFIIIILVILVKAFIGLVILSVLIVPLTWIYSKICGQSYNFTIDQSEMLYKLNKFGQWSMVFGLAFVIYLLFYNHFLN